MNRRTHQTPEDTVSLKLSAFNILSSVDSTGNAWAASAENASRRWKGSFVNISIDISIVKGVVEVEMVVEREQERAPPATLKICQARCDE